MSDLSLGNEFSTPDRDAWLGLVTKVLKGGDADKRLISHTYDGLRIEPLYDGNTHPVETTGSPGQAPFRRGINQASIHLCQSFSHPDIARTNAEILEDLAGGVTAIRLHIDDGVSGGIILKDLSDLKRVLDGVFIDIIPVEIDAGTRALEIAAMLSTLWQGQHITPTAQGAFLIDPIGLYAARGDIDGGVETAVIQSAQVAKETSSHSPQVIALCADLRNYHLAGASPAQETAIAAATGVAYLRSLEDSGMQLAAAASQISFLLNVDTDVFLNIAKLRSFREIWAQITAASGIDAQPATIKLETAKRMMAARDPWVNMLRVTTACFAANVAGAQSVTIAPYTQALGLPDGFGRRIARNTHIVLNEEARLAHVNDPAGGSWFIENLTDQLIETAWKLFQEIEAEGGIVAALKSGFVQSKIAATAKARHDNITVRKDVLVGVNEFPDVSETAVDFIKSSTATGSALPTLRLDHEFEALRASSDKHLAATGKRPEIFLANLGQASDFNVRATFAANIFASGGIFSLTNEGFETAEAAADACKQSGAKIAILCSSEAVYQKFGVATATALKSTGIKHLYLAGAGGDLKSGFEDAGVDSFITVGLDAIATLSAAHELLGVAGNE